MTRLDLEAQNCILHNHGDASLALEAADEIERLRFEVLRLDLQSKFWQAEFQSCWRDLKGDQS